MEVSGSMSPSFRASDADRERTVGLLRDSAVEGRLAHESFIRRVDLALRARDQQSLDDLVADLPAGERVGVSTALRSLYGGLAEQLAAAVMPPRLPALTLPGARQPECTIGRSRNCDVVLDDITVSRVHAALRLFGGQWFLDDLNSTNGTRLNGVRLRKAARVRHGDHVRFGRLAFRVEGGARN